MSVADLDESRLSFNWRPATVRWLVWHMCQNLIYKHGQLATLFFQLGLDGDDPYRAPLPRDDYARLREMLEVPAIAWALSSEGSLIPPSALSSLNDPDRHGCTALHYACRRGDATKVEQLLGNESQVDPRHSSGGTPLMEAAWEGHLDIVDRLLSKGARADLRTEGGYTALDFARMQGHTAVVSLLEPTQPKE